MSAVEVTAPLPAVTYQEPTHRFGRALDDRLPFSGAPTTVASPIHTASVPSSEGNAAATDDDGFSFNDLLDIVNPLQHLPVVSTLYREFTGDEIRPEARVVGGGIFGGIVGAAASLVDVAVEELSGDTLGGHVMTALFGDEEVEPASEDNRIQVAADRSTDTPLPLPVAASIAPPAAAARARQAETPQAPVSDQNTPELQTLSPGAFDALLKSFGASATPTNNDTRSEAGLAYARPPKLSGQVVNDAF